MVLRGEIEADSRQDAINRLTRIGHFPISIELQNISSLDRKKFPLLSNIPGKKTANFTRQLSDLIEAGINLIKALQILQNQTENKYLKAVLNDIIARVKDGSSLSESLKIHPKLFNELYTAMVHSGEIGGRLEISLNQLADYMEKQEEFKSAIRSSLVYPAFIFIVGIITVGVLLTFVIPKLIVMFDDMGQTLPLPTKILITLSDILRSFGWFIAGTLSLCLFFSRKFLLTPEGNLFMSRLQLKFKILKPLMIKTEVSRLMRTLSILLSSGVTIVYSLDIAASIIKNQILKNDVKTIQEKITKGLSFSSALSDSKLFPDFVTCIVAIGEESGSMPKALARIADDYEKDVDRTLNTLKDMLEPAIILFMGLMVGFIVLAMLLPIFQINLMAG